jgi:hypothetical protein
VNLTELQAASSSKLIAFDAAEVIGGFLNDTYFLVARGKAPCLNMDVRLVPRIYIDCPEYWAIELTGTLHGGFCLEAVKPYAVTLSLAGVTGSRGIELVGGNRTQRFDVRGGCGQSDQQR